MAERKTRGTVILTYLKFVKKKWGKVGLETCLSDIGLDADENIWEKYKSEF